jgi:hypothetical protein
MVVALVDKQKKRCCWSLDERQGGKITSLGLYEKVASKALGAISCGPWRLVHLSRLASIVDEDFCFRLGVALGWREVHDWLLSLSEEDRLEFIDRLNENWSRH